MHMPFFKSHTCKYETGYMFILASADLLLMKDTSPNSKAQMHQYCFYLFIIVVVVVVVVVVVIIKVLSPGYHSAFPYSLFAVLDMLLFWVED